MKSEDKTFRHPYENLTETDLARMAMLDFKREKCLRIGSYTMPVTEDHVGDRLSSTYERLDFLRRQRGVIAFTLNAHFEEILKDLKAVMLEPAPGGFGFVVNITVFKKFEIPKLGIELLLFRASSSDQKGGTIHFGFLPQILQGL